MGKIVVENKTLFYNKKNMPNRIVSLSDIHDDGKESRAQKYKELLTIIEKMEPNYICVPGDTLEHGAYNTYNVEMLIRNLGRIAPTILSIGNHFLQLDMISQLITFEWFKNLERFSNVHPLHDDVFDTDDVHFVGLTSQVEIYKNKYRSLWESMFVNSLNDIEISFPIEKFSVLLCHSPLTIMNLSKETLENLNFNLILSGHMHNGCTPEFVAKIFDQFKFSRNIGLLSPYFTFFENYCRGMEKLDDDMFLHINKGFRKWTHDKKIMNLADDMYNKDVSLLELKRK